MPTVIRNGTLSVYMFIHSIGMEQDIYGSYAYGEVQRATELVIIWLMNSQLTPAKCR